jgi:hypothetical protein
MASKLPTILDNTEGKRALDTLKLLLPEFENAVGAGGEEVQDNHTGACEAHPWKAKRAARAVPRDGGRALRVGRQDVMGAHRRKIMDQVE